MKTTVLVITAVMALACAARAQQFNEFGLGAGNDTSTGSQNTGIGYNALHLITAGLRQHGQRIRGAPEQHDRYRERGQRRSGALFQHERLLQHGRRLPSARQL